MKSVGVIGWNGKFNYGDDVMHVVLLDYLSKYFDGEVAYKVVADKNSLPDYDAVFRNKLSISAVKGLDKMMKIPLLRRLIARLFLYPIFLRDIDVLVIGGGKIIVSAIGAQNLIVLINSLKKRNPNAVILGYGLSLGPFVSSEHESKSRELLKLFDYMMLRDRRSFETAVQLADNETRKHLTYSADPALNFGSLYSGKRGAKDKTGRLGIALRRGYESDAFLGSLVTVINNWLSENRDNSVTLFNFCTFDSVKQDDRPLSLKLKGKLAAEYCSRTDVIDYRGNLIEFSDSLLGCALLISVRLHASVLAYTLNIPFVMISYDEKCLDFAREISLKRQYLFLYQDITQGDDVLIKAVADLSMTDLTKNTISVKPLSDVKKPLLDSLLNTSKYLDS